MEAESEVKEEETAQYVEKARIARLAYLQVRELKHLVNDVKLKKATFKGVSQEKSEEQLASPVEKNNRCSLSYKCHEVHEIIERFMDPSQDDPQNYFDYVNSEKYGTDCYIFSNKSNLIIAWRGTEATAEDGFSLQDIKQDLKFNQTKFHYLDQPVLLVHSGFLQQYAAVRDKVHSCLEKRLFGGGAVQEEKSGSTLTISCVGHSLGGALAILCTLDLQMNKPLPYVGYDIEVECTTFGAPKVGNRAFVNCFREQVKKCTQWAFKMDIVPNLPPFSRYKHVAKLRYLKRHNNTLLPQEVHHYCHYLEATKDISRRQKYCSVKGLKPSLAISLVGTTMENDSTAESISEKRKSSDSDSSNETDGSSENLTRTGTEKSEKTASPACETPKEHKKKMSQRKQKPPDRRGSEKRKAKSDPRGKICAIS